MADGYEGLWGGLDSTFRSRLERMMADSGGRIYLQGGYRSDERQLELWNAAVAKYGSETAANKWVARPISLGGKGSNHNRGVAADIGYYGDGSAWAHSNAAAYGLSFPMSWEPWHIEPIGVREGTYVSDGGESYKQNLDAYTIPPAGQTLGAGEAWEPGSTMEALGGILSAMQHDPLGAGGDPLAVNDVDPLDDEVPLGGEQIGTNKLPLSPDVVEHDTISDRLAEVREADDG